MFGKNDLGKPIFNLKIKVVWNQSNFGNIKTGLTETIKTAGLAIHYAKDLLEKEWKITEKGYMIEGGQINLPWHEATIHIDENIHGIHELQRKWLVIDSKREIMRKVHCHFNKRYKGETIYTIWYDHKQEKFYIDEIKREKEVDKIFLTLQGNKK